MAEQSSSIPAQANPYLLPPDQHGWRGLTVPGNRKRKWYTLLHNDMVLVTGLLLMPGEASVQHSHESGELSIAYNDVMKPVVTWHPGGEVHAGPPPAAAPMVAPSMEEVAAMGGSKALAELVHTLVQQQQQMKQQMDEMRRRDISPRIIVDILFPPFKTTIKDDAYPQEVTITGQWYD